MWLWLATALASDPFAVDAKVRTLDNGLTVILAEDHNTDTIALHLHYGVGARDEGVGEYGCAHLFEHLMFEGSENVPNNAFDEWLTAAGGWNNAYTSEDETAYYMSFPSGALDLALMLESDRMGFLEAGLTAENLANQQDVVLQERFEGYEEPRGRNWDALALVGWPAEHPYQHTVIGTVADIEGYDIDGVVSFWQRGYRPRNAVLALVGNFDSEAALARVEHWFSDIEDPGPAKERAQPIAITNEVKGDHYITDKVEDRAIWMAYPSVPLHHEDEYALDVLANVLSDGRGTRLDDALLYKGKNFSSLTSFQSSSELGGHFMILATSDTKTLPVIKKKIDKQLAKLAKKPPTEAELERAKKSIRSNLLGSLESLTGRANALADCQRQLGKADCTGMRWERYDAVTTADVMRVFETYVKDENLVTLSVVPPGAEGTIEGATEVEIR